ncbi:MAG: PAS domain S-box protein [Gammaproteobacteria bacterium]
MTPSHLSPDEPQRGGTSASVAVARTPPALRWSRLLWLALAYFVAAQLSLAFAIPPGYAAPLWPAAGLALVGLVVWGRRCWPAVWVGSFAANLVNQSVVSGADTTPTLVALAALIAAGATLQAALGVRLVQRFVEVPEPLAQERHALHFLALGGPLACLVSATVGVAGLYFLRGLPAEALAANWIAWWAGDSLGVLLFAPLVILVLPESSGQWRGRALQIAVPLLVTGALVVAGYVWMNRAEEAAYRDELVHVAEDVRHALETKLIRDVGSVQGLASLFDASEKVTRVEFSTFSRSALGWSDVQTLAWLPRVPRAQREAVEAAARRDGVHDFVFRERDSENRRLVPAGERAEYYPALYIATRDGKQSAALGFDAGAAAASRATLQRAMESARPVLAEREAFYDRDAARSDDWRLYVPVYRAGFDARAAGVEARREALRGFAVGVFYINKLFAPMAAPTGLQRIGYRLTNLSDPGPTRLLLESSVPAARATQPDASHGIEGLAGNSLLLETWSLAPWQPAQSATGKIYLLASVLITLLAAVFVLATAGQGVRVAREVSRRTAELERELENRRRAERALATETDRLSLALASSNLSMWELNPRTGQLTLDGRWATMMGAEPGGDKIVTTAEELLNLIPADDRGRVRAAALDTIKGLSPDYQVEHQVRTKAGELRWIQSHGKGVERNARGRVLRLIGTNLDITERKQGEQELRALNEDLERIVAERTVALRASERRFAGLFEHAPDAVVMIDAQGRIKLVNRQAQALFGYSREELVGQAVEKLIPESSRLRHAGLRQGFFRHPSARSMGAGQDIFALRKDGSTFPADISLSPVESEEGMLVSAAVRDDTERKQAEATLEEQRQQLAEAQRLAHIGSWIWNIATDEIICSDEYFRLHGLAPQEVKSSRDVMRERMHPDDREMLRQCFEQAFQDHRPFDFDYRAVWPDGTVRFLHGRGEVLLDGAGQPKQVSGTAQDITEQREQEADRQARAVAERGNEAKSSFLAMMSHEIRTPLNGLLGLLELLQLSFLNDEQTAELNMAMDSGRSLARIIDDLLDYSKIEAGKLEIHPQPASVASIVEGVKNTFLARASEKGLILASVIDARIRPVLNIDALRLSQILNNFVSNALKFTEKGHVEIHAELVQRDDASDTVRLSVKDTGIGVTPEDQQRLFEPYEQAHGAIPRMYGGTGLGLAICRRLTELMDGRIAMDSTLGQGTTLSVTFILPVVEGQPLDVLALTPSVTGIPTPSFSGLPILAVDDHPTNRTVLERQLGKIGLQAELAESGEQALARWREGRYALIITDIHMPHMDGYALTRAIREIEGRENRPRIPIIAWTASAMPEDRTRCLAAGMDDFLAKPVELQTLQQTLGRWLPTSEAPAAGETTPTRINLEALNKLSGSSTEQAEILKEFEAQTRKDFDALKAALDKSDMPAVKRTAHSMKGSSRMVGAQELATLCEALEHSLRANDVGRRIALVAELTKALQRLQKAIRDYR